MVFASALWKYAGRKDGTDAEKRSIRRDLPHCDERHRRWQFRSENDAPENCAQSALGILERFKRYGRRRPRGGADQKPARGAKTFGLQLGLSFPHPCGLSFAHCDFGFRGRRSSNRRFQNRLAARRNTEPHFAGEPPRVGKPKGGVRELPCNGMKCSQQPEERNWREDCRGDANRGNRCSEDRKQDAERKGCPSDPSTSFQVSRRSAPLAPLCFGMAVCLVDIPSRVGLLIIFGHVWMVTDGSKADLWASRATREAINCDALIAFIAAAFGRWPRSHSAALL